MVRAENVTGPVAYHAEGLVRSDARGGRRLVDELVHDLHTRRESGVNQLQVGALDAFDRPRARDGHVVATDYALGLSDSTDGQPRPFAPKGRRASGPAGSVCAAMPGVRGIAALPFGS